MTATVAFRLAVVDADFFIALGTIILAMGTVALAFFTYRLASATRKEERAQWRPVLIPLTDLIERVGDEEFRLRLQNVGRGPALGVNGQLRIDGPSGAVVPGQPSICVEGGDIDLFFSFRGDYRPGAVHHFEVTYYDIGEWWHVTDLRALGREEENGKKPLRINTTFVNQQDRQLGAVFGSRMAKAREGTGRKSVLAFLSHDD
jgi:hypothetical protein